MRAPQVRHAEPNPPREAGSKAALRVIRLLEVLARNTGIVSVRTLGDGSQIGKSSVSRLLTMLHQEGWIVRDAEQAHFGPAALIFAASVLSHSDVRELLRPFMETVRDLTEESVLVGMLDGHEVLYIDRVDSNHAVRFSEGIGSRRPLHTTSAGKAMLSAMPRNKAKQLLAKTPLVRKTVHTHVRMADILREMDLARLRGYAISREEHTTGVSGVSVPLRNLDVAEYATLTVAGPAERMNNRLDTLGEMVLGVATSINAVLEGVKSRGGKSK